MRFDVDQRFTIAPARVVDILFDERFITARDELASVEGSVLLEQSRDGATIRQRVRSRFSGNLPGPVTAVIDPQRLVWVEETVFDVDTSSGTFRIVPDHYADRLRCSGTQDLQPTTDGGSIRRISGELDVRYRFVGGAVERAIVTGLQRHLHDEIGLIERFAENDG